MENCPLEVSGFLSLSHLGWSMLSEHQTSPFHMLWVDREALPNFLSLCSLAELTSVWNKPFLYQEVMAKTLCPIVHQLIHWQRFVKGKPSIRNLSAHPRWCYACSSLCFPFEVQIFISKVFWNPNIPHWIPALTAGGWEPRGLLLHMYVQQKTLHSSSHEVNVMCIWPPLWRT